MVSHLLQKYKKFQTKFSLPRLTELKATFSFELEDGGEIFGQIRNEISEKMFSFTESIIEPMIGNPDSLSCLYEQNMLTKSDKERLFQLYKKIQILKWKNNILTIHPSEESNAEWVRETWDFWNKELKKELTGVCSKLCTGWKEFKFNNEATQYHG